MELGGAQHVERETLRDDAKIEYKAGVTDECAVRRPVTLQQQPGQGASAHF